MGRDDTDALRDSPMFGKSLVQKVEELFSRRTRSKSRALKHDTIPARRASTQTSTRGEACQSERKRSKSRALKHERGTK
jgi:hypothetical protein